MIKLSNNRKSDNIWYICMNYYTAIKKEQTIQTCNNMNESYRC